MWDVRYGIGLGLSQASRWVVATVMAVASVRSRAEGGKVTYQVLPTLMTLTPSALERRLLA